MKTTFPLTLFALALTVLVLAPGASAQVLAEDSAPAIADTPALEPLGLEIPVAFSASTEACYQTCQDLYAACSSWTCTTSNGVTYGYPYGGWSCFNNYDNCLTGCEYGSVIFSCTPRRLGGGGGAGSN